MCICSCYGSVYELSKDFTDVYFIEVRYINTVYADKYIWRFVSGESCLNQFKKFFAHVLKSLYSSTVEL